MALKCPLLMNFVSGVIIVVRVFLVVVLGAVGFTLQHRTIVSREKASAYECGLDPNMSARIPFSLRFFLLAVIFLVFDVEIALLMGVPLRIRASLRVTVYGARVLLVVLVLGLLHEWREGSLN